MMLRVAMLSWEHPPVIVGGLARHVAELSRSLAALGHEVTVFTRGPGGDCEEHGVRVVRAPIELPPPRALERFIRWVLDLNQRLVRMATPVLSAQPPDVLHAHDWLVQPAANALSRGLGIPLVATIHATEHGRQGGRLRGAHERRIHGVERGLVSDAARVIVCSAFMRNEVRRLFGAPASLVSVIPNGVGDAPRIDSERESGTLLFAGRLEHEKGVQTVLDALPLVARVVPDVRLDVAGSGSRAKWLAERAARLGITRRVRFLGFLEDEALAFHYGRAGAVLIPSLYEPFGLVALESMAAGAPVAASDAGGLREIVRHGVTGLRFRAGDAADCAGATVRLLTEPLLARRLARTAKEALTGFRWDLAARRTAGVYREVLTPPSSSAARLS